MAVAIALADDSVIVREGSHMFLPPSRASRWWSPAVTSLTAGGRRERASRRGGERHPDAADEYRRGHPRGGAAAREHPDIGVVVLSNYAEPRRGDGTAGVRIGGPRLSAQGAHPRPRATGGGDRVGAAGGFVVDSKIVEPLVTARGYVQRRRTSCRCQRSSVCGVTSRPWRRRRQQPGCAGKPRPVTRPSAGRPT